MSRFPDALLRLVLNGPSVLASLVIYLVVLTSLPDAVMLPAAVVVVVAMSLPASGRVEAWVVRVVTRSQEGSPDGIVLWDRVEALVETADAEGGAIGERRLLVRCSLEARVAPVAHAGRASVVVSPHVLQHLATQQISPAAVACEVISSRVEHHFTAERGAVRGWFMTLPTRMLAVVVGPLMRKVCGWAPCRVAWHLRMVVGVSCVADGASHGRAWSGAAAGVLVLISYAVPAARKEVSRRAASQADDGRGADARSRCPLEGGNEHAQAVGPGGSQLVGLPRLAGGVPSPDHGDRPRLYLVRTE